MSSSMSPVVQDSDDEEDILSAPNPSNHDSHDDMLFGDDEQSGRVTFEESYHGQSTSQELTTSVQGSTTSRSLSSKRRKPTHDADHTAEALWDVPGSPPASLTSKRGMYGQQRGSNIQAQTIMSPSQSPTIMDSTASYERRLEALKRSTIDPRALMHENDTNHLHFQSELPHDPSEHPNSSMHFTERETQDDDVTAQPTIVINTSVRRAIEEISEVGSKASKSGRSRKAPSSKAPASSQEDLDAKDALIGLPKDLYNPRPSRSRAAKQPTESSLQDASSIASPASTKKRVRKRKATPASVAPSLEDELHDAEDCEDELAVDSATPVKRRNSRRNMAKTPESIKKEVDEIEEISVCGEHARGKDHDVTSIFNERHQPVADDAADDAGRETGEDVKNTSKPAKKKAGRPKKTKSSKKSTITPKQEDSEDVGDNTAEEAEEINQEADGGSMMDISAVSEDAQCPKKNKKGRGRPKKGSVKEEAEILEDAPPQADPLEVADINDPPADDAEKKILGERDANQQHVQSMSVGQIKGNDESVITDQKLKTSEDSKQEPQVPTGKLKPGVPLGPQRHRVGLSRQYRVESLLKMRRK